MAHSRNLVLTAIVFRLSFVEIPTIVGSEMSTEAYLSIKSVEEKNTTNAQCATIQVTKCQTNNSSLNVTNCSETSFPVFDYWSKRQVKDTFTNITGLKVRNKCIVSVCEDDELMGYCAMLLGKNGLQVASNNAKFGNLLHSKSLSMQCTCSSVSGSQIQSLSEDNPFDRNLVGLVYSPYDKYWEPTGPNGTLKPVPWKNYTEGEIRDVLTVASKKFSYISTYGIGAASNTSTWDKGDKIAFVPKVAAELNTKLGFPAIRVSVGIYRKDDVTKQWNRRELYNALDASEFANKIFNGTVWGVVVTSQYVDETPKAEQALQMIKTVKSINKEKNLRLKIGIRLDKCDQYPVNIRPEDEIGGIYQDPTIPNYVPLTSFQESLHTIAKNVDFILCLFIPPGEFVGRKFPDMISGIQGKFSQIKNALKKINENVTVIFETGVPSQGIGNQIRQNSVHNMKQYWFQMAQFAMKANIKLHMLEAVDQPWKNVQTASTQRQDINAPNGADGFYGWWKRNNNSVPANYIEKILDNSTSTTITPLPVDPDYPKNTPSFVTTDGTPTSGSSSPLVTILIMSFFALFLLTATSVGYLTMKLRKAKKQVISPAYIEQFISGGDACATKDDNYAVALRIPYNKKYELAKENFYIDKSAVMGSGQCGVVLRGTIKDREGPVAFKCTTPSSTVVDIKSLMSEIKILSYIGSHENVVCLLGAYTKKIERGIIYVALEYCSLGSLESFLRKVDPHKLKRYCNSINGDTEVEIEQGVEYSVLGVDNGSGSGSSVSGVDNAAYVSTLDELPDEPLNRYVSKFDLEVATSESSRTSSFTPTKPSEHSQVDIATFYKWAYQICSAMEYVSDKNVIHADLASRNVLLASLDQVKVSDFGLSRKMYQEMGVVHDKDTPLPWRWMAPESLKHLVVSVESDVWAFAVTCWEIFSLAEVPYHGFTYDMQFVKILERGIRLPQPKYAPPKIHEQLLKCWNFSPQHRPSFTDLKNYFHVKLTELGN